MASYFCSLFIAYLQECSDPNLTYYACIKGSSILASGEACWDPNRLEAVEQSRVFSAYGRANQSINLVVDSRFAQF